MSVDRLYVRGYRSIHDLELELGQVTVVFGPNGCGKTNLYRSLVLLQAAAQGRLARALAAEGGMPSVLWAGPVPRKQKRRVQLEVEMSDFTYSIELGLPIPRTSMFARDPEVKAEAVWVSGQPRVRLLERGNASAWVIDEEANKTLFPFELAQRESVLSQLSDPRRFVDLWELRSRFDLWRFYHQFRTDEHSPIKQQRVGVWTPSLSPEGTDLSSALQTIYENGDGAALDRAVSDAFSGASLSLKADDMARIVLKLKIPGLQRPLDIHELSDGTLRYLCLVAALLAPQPAPLLALNEPETSLHERLLEPLARLIHQCSERSQIWVTTHSQALADDLAERVDVTRAELRMEKGRTVRVE